MQDTYIALAGHVFAAIDTGPYHEILFETSLRASRFKYHFFHAEDDLVLVEFVTGETLV